MLEDLLRLLQFLTPLPVKPGISTSRWKLDTSTSACKCPMLHQTTKFSSWPHTSHLTLSKEVEVPWRVSVF